MSNEPAPPSRPDNRRRSGSGSNAPTLLALTGLAAAAFSLLGLAALVMPQLLGVLLVAVLIFVPAVFHYLLWGRWLSQMRDEEAEADKELRRDE